MTISLNACSIKCIMSKMISKTPKQPVNIKVYCTPPQKPSVSAETRPAKGGGKAATAC